MRRLSLLLLLSFTLLSCDKSSPVVKIAHVSWPGYESFSLAKNRKLYKDLEVKISRLDNNRECITAYNNKVVDAVALTINTAFELNHDENDPNVIIAILDVSNGGDAIVAKKSIKSVSDLKNKRIGIEPSALGAYIFSRAIEKQNIITASEVSIVPLNNVNHYRFFTNSDIDAVITYEPFKSQILNKNGHVIFDSKQIKNEIVDVLITRQSFLNKHKNELTRLLNGHFLVVEQLGTDRKNTIKEMAALENTSTDNFTMALSGIHIPGRQENIRMLNPSSSPLLETIASTGAFLLKNNIINEYKALKLDNSVVK